MVQETGPETWNVTTEGSVKLPSLSVYLFRYHMGQPTNHKLWRDDSYWLDLCVTPRPDKARACYPDQWGPHRFERMGDIFMVPPRHLMQTRSDEGGDQTSIVCEISSGHFRDWLDDDFEWTDRRLEASLDVVSPNIRATLFRFAEEVRYPGFGSVVLFELLAGQLAIEVSRYCTSLIDGPVTGGLASWRLRIIDERLEQSGTAPTLTELASHCNMSIRQMTRGFRTSKGCSIGDYIAQVRIEQAKRLLGTDESIKSIAFAMGFASPSSFSFAFRKAIGSTPRQYRQRQMRKQL